jgi:hypothetical protein
MGMGLWSSAERTSEWLARYLPLGPLIRRRCRSISSAAESAGQGVGGVAVEVVPGAVVAPGGAGVGVAGEVLEVPEGDAGVQGGGDRRVTRSPLRTSRVINAADRGPSSSAAPSSAIRSVSVNPLVADRSDTRGRFTLTTREAERRGARGSR